ncbi:hypothetical protein AVEN_41085-1 [Araneus ventricosus]|uniref:Uncharacterized protein n=1 Tax=Araneus ventricosus TaxID=182803 RepID=A0A4Y2TJ15_ARAVE|nr:hypothetical protein AVEN_41085-1 [Araneus ventricosus]
MTKKTHYLPLPSQSLHTTRGVLNIHVFIVECPGSRILTSAAKGRGFVSYCPKDPVWSKNCYMLSSSESNILPIEWCGNLKKCRVSYRFCHQNGDVVPKQPLLTEE